MPKNKSGPKAIANRWKAKGLQKLRWYCQMCQKQCRDENGFKCHCTSESHLRQMAIFANNSTRIMDEFSNQFEKDFLTLLSRRFGVRRVHSNIVYNEYIADKEHIHMTSTMWTTLTEFVKYLGRESKCVIDETEKGWYIQYIDRDPRALARQEALAKMKKHELNEEDRRRRHIAKQVAAAQAASDGKAPEYTELKRTDDTQKVKVAIKRAEKRSALQPTSLDLGANVKRRRVTESDTGRSQQGLRGVSSRGGVVGGSALDAIMAQEEAQKQRELAREYALEQEQAAAAAAEAARKKQNKPKRKSYWLVPGIVVKCLNKTAGGGSFYKKKGFVKKVVDKYAAVVKLIDSGVKLQIDQAELETVIPKAGGDVHVVNGEHRGSTGIVKRIDVDKFAVVVKLRGGEVATIPYEDVCKIHRK